MAQLLSVWSPRTAVGGVSVATAGLSRWKVVTTHRSVTALPSGLVIALSSVRCFGLSVY